jgi:hypothetical protein
MLFSMRMQEPGRAFAAKNIFYFRILYNLFGSPFRCLSEYQVERVVEDSTCGFGQ